MSGVQIDIQRTGFPVKVGEVELWFNASLENLKTFFSIEEVVNERMEKIAEQAQHLHFPEQEEYSAELAKEATESTDKLIDLGKEQVALEYDLVLGDGTFKKLYKKYPDFEALAKAKDPLFLAIADKIGEMEKERADGFEAIKKEALKQKQQKKKK